MDPTHQEIESQETARLFGHLVGRRLLVIPLFLALFGTAVAFEPWGWHRALLLVCLVAAPAFFVSEFIRYRLHGVTPRTITFNLAGGILGQMVVAFATGGLASPVIYVAIPLAAIATTLLPRRLTAALTVYQIGCIWLFAALAASASLPNFNPRIFGGGPSPVVSEAYLYSHAAILSFVLFLTAKLGQLLKRMFDDMIRRALTAQQESLEAHAERIQELTSLSAEIAHELKNPLASVKGLAALLAQNVSEGKAAERLAVLRREVDRMQSVLEGFLNFSRPLSPLALTETESGELCREVAVLHEGLAHSRGVSIEVEADDVTVRGDPRKMKQILINVVQNAIEASSQGDSIVIECTKENGCAVIAVLDQGQGLDASLGNVFEPGVTSKASGSGIGLTIARALARQHEGDLELRRREPRGMVAVLRLPLEGPGPRPVEKVS